MENLKSKLTELLNKDFNDTELVNQISNLLNEEELHSKEKSETYSAVESCNKYFLKLLDSETENQKIKTDFSTFDKYTGGLILSDFIIIGGRSGMGKTQLLVNLALNISKTHSSLFISNKLSDYYLNQRFLSCISQLPLEKLFLIEKEQSIEKYTNAISQLKSHSLFFNFHLESMVELENSIRRNVANNGVKVVFIDHLQSLSFFNSNLKKNDEHENISKMLKNIAKKLNILIIASSFIKPQDEYFGDIRPTISNLNDGYKLEQFADLIILLFRPEYYNILENEEGVCTKNKVEVFISKNKKAKTKNFTMSVDDYFTHFKDNSNPSDRFNKELEMLKKLDDSFKIYTQIL